MIRKKYQIGLIGLGVMGRNLILNMVDHGYSVAGYDKNSEPVRILKECSSSQNILATDDFETFIFSLESPKIIMIFVPAGNPVNLVIENLIPYLKAGDILIDGGNSFYLDTEARQNILNQNEIYLIGMGVSGGEQGAREGPCLMPGGNEVAYETIRPILENIAAHVAGKPCVTYIGRGGSGNYVKMIHNGIEYGVMQLIAEIYDILKTGLGMSNKAIAQLYSSWNKTEASCYLLEITANIFNCMDPDTQDCVINYIIDVAEEKGTGSWTSEESLKLQQPTPTITTAVMLRHLSVFKMIRLAANEELQGPNRKFEGNQEEFLKQLQQAFYMSLLLTYIQGMNLLQQASKVYNYQFKLENIARIWLGGCIIRSSLLNQIAAAFHLQPALSNLLLDAYFAQELSRCQNDLRSVISKIVLLGIPIAGLTASLEYYDAFRSKWLPANLIQAQRDYFGAHTYKRVDKQGVFHTNWVLTN